MFTILGYSSALEYSIIRRDTNIVLLLYYYKGILTYTIILDTVTSSEVTLCSPLVNSMPHHIMSSYALMHRDQTLYS